jgi:bacterioferritin (cytochrome b1)
MKDRKDRAGLIDELNDALNHELTTVVRYILEGSSVQGIQFEPLRQLYREEVLSGVSQAQHLADTIIRLGGVPQAKLEVFPRPHEIARMADMVNRDVRAEEADGKRYEALATLAEKAGESDLKVWMEYRSAGKLRHAERLRVLLDFPAGPSEADSAE